MRHDSVVLVHDYLTQRGGAERVVMALTRGFPESPLVTSLYEPQTTFPEFAGLDIRTSALEQMPLLPQHHRLGLPLYPAAFSNCVVDAPVTLCSTSGWAHGVRARGKKLLYVYTPARWLYAPDQYLGARPSATKTALRAVSKPLRAWDRRAARSADRIVTVSRAMRQRIRSAWGCDAEVIPPPHAASVDGQQQSPAHLNLEPGFLLLVARLLPYKGVDAVMRAMEELPGCQLVVVGDGPERHRLEQQRPPNAVLLGRVEEPVLRWLYANCAALVSAAIEDFGLSVLEAAAFGKPSVVLRAGGFLETVVEGRTGLFFDSRDPHAIAESIHGLDTLMSDQTVLKQHASRYSEENFTHEIHRVVSEML